MLYSQFPQKGETISNCNYHEVSKVKSSRVWVPSFLTKTDQFWPFRLNLSNFCWISLLHFHSNPAANRGSSCSAQICEQYIQMREVHVGQNTIQMHESTLHTWFTCQAIQNLHLITETKIVQCVSDAVGSYTHTRLFYRELSLQLASLKPKHDSLSKSVTAVPVCTAETAVPYCPHKNA
jgi:hypothetical protein